MEGGETSKGGFIRDTACFGGAATGRGRRTGFVADPHLDVGALENDRAVRGLDPGLSRKGAQE